ncbi:MAG: Hsp70 family protein [Verrucomicrobiota bacterium]
MAIAMDFGTCNTVFVRWNHATRQAELVDIPKLTRRFPYRLPDRPKELTASVVPTLIHYGEKGSPPLGEQVATDGLVDHQGTFRWLKLDLLKGNDKGKNIHGIKRTPRQAATYFVTDTLTFALGALGGGANEELVITVPVEAEDGYVDWLRRTVESVAGGRRVQVLDEATACILGYQETVKNDDVYAIADFGGGTFDFSIVRVNLGAEGLKKCLIRGRAGEELGGMLVDHWMLERMKAAEKLSDADIREVGTPLLRGIEEAKIKLSRGAPGAEAGWTNDLTGLVISHTFTPGELREVLERHDFFKLVARTVDRALQAADDKYKVKKRDIQRVFLVGGTSLLLGVRELMGSLFPDRPVEFGKPFEAIAAGACRYAGQDFDPTLVHDYAVESWNPELKEFELVTVIEKGTQYPTNGAIKGKYLSAACDQADELKMVVYELTEIVRPGTTLVMGPDGRMMEQQTGTARVERRRPLNPEAEDFLRPNPPCDRDETKRFVVGFGVNENKCLTISVKDTRPGNRSKVRASDGRFIDLPIRNEPLVRL